MVPFTRTSRFRTTDKNLSQQLCTDTECSLEDLPEAMDDGNEWRERERERESESENTVLLARHDDDDDTHTHTLTYIYIYNLYLFTSFFAGAGCNTRSVFKQSLTILNSEFSNFGMETGLRLKNTVCPAINP